MPQEAILCYQRALQVQPDYVTAYGECFQNLYLSVWVFLGFSLYGYASRQGSGSCVILASRCEVIGCKQQAFSDSFGLILVSV